MDAVRHDVDAKIEEGKKVVCGAIDHARSEVARISHKCQKVNHWYCYPAYLICKGFLKVAELVLAAAYEACKIAADAIRATFDAAIDLAKEIYTGAVKLANAVA